MTYSSSYSDNLINFHDVSSLSEAEVAKELEKRFWEGKFYTWVGLSLLAVNPGKLITDLYTPETKAYYEEIWKKNKPNEIPPHIFAVSSRAKYRMLQEIGKVGQAIVLTGESGSGKTHCTNHLVDFLVTCEGEPFQGSNLSLCHWASVLLKAFGNAKTDCNSDSSRFGKFILLYWLNETHIAPQFVGAHLDAYLLEKTRVTDFPGGWNFNIFHQITSGLSEDDAVALYFPSSRKFRIAPRQDSDIHKRSYGETSEAAEKIGLSKNEWRCVLDILAAILHLGNVDFQNEREDVCTIKSNKDSMEGMRRGCHLLGIEESLLTQLFTTKLIVANGRGNGQRRGLVEDVGGRGDTQAAGRAEEGLRQRLHCLPHARRPSIFRKQCSLPRLLDIFGFESFEKNGLEQLCINYTNERLQRFYIQNDLVKSQEMLEEEGLIPFGTEYHLENLTKESLFDSPTSIFSILNDESKITWRSVDESVVDKLAGLKSPHLSVLPIEKTDFMVHHYAGIVTYSSTGMVTKNLDKVPDELVEFLAMSNNDFLKTLLHQGEQRKQAWKATHLTKFVDSLNELMKKLDDMDVHYVHCLKPHPVFKTGIIDSAYFLQQLKYAGVMESIDLHKKAFPIRMKFDEFLERYNILASVNQDSCLDPLLATISASQNSSTEDDKGYHESEWTEETKLKFKCEEIIGSVFKDKEANVKWGRSSLFLSESNVVSLEMKKESIYNEAASVIQKHWRMFKSRLSSNCNTQSCASPLSTLGGCSVPLSKALSGGVDCASRNATQKRWNAYSLQCLKNSWKNLEQISYLIGRKSEERLIYGMCEQENEKKIVISDKSWMKTYSPTGLFLSCSVAKDFNTECSSCQDKFVCSENSKTSSRLNSLMRSIYNSSGIISRQKIPEDGGPNKKSGKTPRNT